MRAEAFEEFRVEILTLAAKHGLTGRFVRAYCKLQGWRYGAQGAPAQWYEWWPMIAEVLASR